MYVTIAQFVKALAAPTRARSRVQEVRGSTRRADKLNSVFHPSGVGNK